MNDLLLPYRLGNTILRNRIIKSGIYEGRCDRNGFPTESYYSFYRELARNGVGGIISGFAYISDEGRAMQPFQAGIDGDSKIPYYKKLTGLMHDEGCPVFLQIAHTGRQTLKSATGQQVRGCSSKRSVYFRGNPKPFSTKEVIQKIEEFGHAAYLARESGFDGVQLHAAHGYLIHQFLLKAVNNRKDEFGIENGSGLGLEFFRQVILNVRLQCGEDYPLMVKISGGTDLVPSFTIDHFKKLISFLDKMKVDAIEISYGTMDHALNIFRGDLPDRTILQHNPILHSENRIRRHVNQYILRKYFVPRLRPFTPAYNLEYARVARKISGIPIISVGGFRTGEEIQRAISDGSADLVGLARPFICEPDFINKLKEDGSYASQCTNCNICAVMCDAGRETRCYNH